MGMESPLNRIVADDSCGAARRGGAFPAEPAAELAAVCSLGLEQDMRDKSIQQDEASLEELLSDPIIWMVMKSDRIEKHELRHLLERVAADLAITGANATAHHNPDREMSMEQESGYRKGVGVMLLNERNEVFVGQRIDARHDAWQMPQGGINEGEDPRDAAFRELKEEVGTDKARIIAESKAWLRYDLPSEAGKRWEGRWRGQRQKWFVMRFEGTDADVNVATEHPEFADWKWVPIANLPNLIVSFKRQLYVDIVREFSDFGGP
jgi:8-oxo-dGTP pyrophosphatase MutT (NUDIX family)